MIRTIKFQLSNIKKITLYSALITYVIIGISLALSLFLNQSALTNISREPIWLNILTLVVAPITLLSLLYALFEGTMFFDTSLRLGISRHSYFITQVIIYIIISLVVTFATGVTEVEWTGSMTNYFETIGQNYFSFNNILVEFLLTLSFAIMTLAFYRFKVKIFIVITGLFGFFMVGAALLNSGFMGSAVIIEIIVNAINFVIAYHEVFVGLLAIGIIGIYYQFITKVEIQD